MSDKCKAREVIRLLESLFTMTAKEQAAVNNWAKQQANEVLKNG